jgi:hypothetical protein
MILAFDQTVLIRLAVDHPFRAAVSFVETAHPSSFVLRERIYFMASLVS